MNGRDFLDVSLTAELRAELLLAQMTLREKCHQIVAVPPWYFVKGDGSDADGLEEKLADAPGHVSNWGVDDPEQHAALITKIQRIAVTRTRLGIPVLFHTEALNGFMSGGHEVFPTAIGLATTWSPELVQEMADIIRRQMRRAGVRQALGPVMDIALDPRWGRFHETYGEDPYLCAALSVAYTRGLQGPDLAEGVIATGKHFLGYGFAEGGVNLSAVHAGPRRIRDLFAYPFEAAIQLADLGSVMNSYSEIDGVPVGASREILTDFLRGTLGFDGFVSSDYMTLGHIVGRQRVARDKAEAARLTITAGLDVENPSPDGYGDVLMGEVERGAVDVEYVDTAVRRVLRAKFELGLFEQPYPDERIELALVAEEGHRLSEELARRSVVLARNESLLPLEPGSLHVAVIGPHADAVAQQFPTYTYPAWREATLMMSSGGLANIVGIDPEMAAWNDTLLPPRPAESYVREQYGATALYEEVARFSPSVVSERGSALTRDLGDEDLARAVSAARAADVVILALGGASLWFQGERTEGEASDTADISLPAAQTRLAAAVAATGTPIVAVLFQGRAYALPEVVRDSGAIVIAPYGGPFGPKAVAEVVFGAVEPSGRLAYSIPRHSGQIPVYHHQKAGSGYRNPLPPNVDQHYLDMVATPLFTFGHGLSYTDFELSDLTCDPTVDTDSAVQICVTVSNSGTRAGATVVQLYVRVNTPLVTRPAQQLAGFARVELERGEARRLTFTVAASQFGYTNASRDFVVEPGPVDFFLGFDAAHEGLRGSFDLAGERRALISSDRAFLSEVAFDHRQHARDTERTPHKGGFS